MVVVAVWWWKGGGGGKAEKEVDVSIMELKHCAMAWSMQ